METITTKSDRFGKLSISENRRYLMEGDKPFSGWAIQSDAFEIK